MSSPTLKSKGITAVVLVLICFAVGYFVTRPQWNTYKITQSQLQAVEAQNADLTRSLATVQSFIDDYNKHLSDVSTANLALPAKKVDNANFIKGISDLAQASGVVMADLQMDSQANSDKIPAANSIQIQRVSFTAFGTYLAFKDFMMRLENHLRLVDVEKINVEASEGDQIQFLVTLRTYYQQ